MKYIMKILLMITFTFLLICYYALNLAKTRRQLAKQNTTSHIYVNLNFKSEVKPSIQSPLRNNEYSHQDSQEIANMMNIDANNESDYTINDDEYSIEEEDDDIEDINDDNEDSSSTNTSAYRELTVDYRRKKHILWPQDRNCSSLEVRFARNISQAFLHSFPRSGNTWVRYLLEAATGIFTSSFYTDRTLIKQGYLGERDKFGQRTTIATKLHFIKHLRKYTWAPCVTIIRNPARLFISLWSYINVKNRRFKHTATIPEYTFKSKEFHTFIQGKLKKWLKTYLFALKHRRKLFPMSYELIKEDPVGQTRRLLEYLRIKPDEKRLACLASHMQGKVKAGQRTINPYTPEEEKQLREAMEVINKYLRKRGLEPMPA